MHGLRNTLMANVSTSKIPVCGWMVKCVQKLMVLDGSHTGPGTASPHPMVWCFGPTGGHGETDLISDGGADD